MSQVINHRTWSLKVAIFSIICTSFAASNSPVLAQIESDTSLGAESSTIRQIEPLVEQIDGGAVRGKNLFHSFQEFNIVEGQKVYFSNPVGVENIIGRVTGVNSSNIQGVLGVLGNANLFLLNPNGIIFGTNASLDIRGSFVASTASSINFADGSQFSATKPQLLPLLTLNVPVGLQFGSNPATIINRSQASPNKMVNSSGLPIGLQVTTGRTLALVGGDINLESGNITVEGGRIEIGSVADSSLVSLNATNRGWTLGYEGIQNFQDTYLSQRSIVDASGEGGRIQIQGRDVILSNAAQILAETKSSGNGGNVSINARKLIALDGSQISTASTGFFDRASLAFIPATGDAGNINVNASEFVELSGVSESFPFPFSGLSSTTFGSGSAGDITINTGKLIVRDGGVITTNSGRVDLPEQTILATGKGGDLDINAFESVELTGVLSKPTGLTTTAQGSGNAGNLTLKTGRLIVQNGAEVAVSSEGTGEAGNLQVQARTIDLDNGGITATSEAGKGGGNIALQDLDSLLLRGGSEISTNARGEGNGGDITIHTDLLTALGNSKITAKASDAGNGGNIRIKTQGLFLSPNSEISATSERGVDGVVEIDRLENDPEGALLTLPTEPVNISGLIAQGCASGGGSMARGSKFVVTGRGGLPPTPKEAFRGEVALADLGKPIEIEATQAKAIAPTNQKPPESTPLVEAQGWVIGSKGEVILTASAPNVTPSVPWMKSSSCHG